jgi:hypothetical protein
MDTRAWLAELSELSTDRIRRAKRSYVPPLVRPVRDEALCRAVETEMRDHAVGLDRTTPGLASALEQVAVQADVDLGFRLFLRAL